jgi:DNA-binding NtrC family response regulator
MMANRVLVYQPSAIIREVCTQVLLDAGFQVDTVGDTTAALSAVASTDYSFIVLGTADNGATAAALREAQAESERYSPLISLSGDDGVCDGFVKMPMNAASLRQSLDNWFHYARGRALVSPAA